MAATVGWNPVVVVKYGKADVTLVKAEVAWEHIGPSWLTEREGRNMTRAGREPAEDVKRRLVSACQEVGLTVTNATMRLLPSGGNRLIYIGGSFAHWPYETPTIGLMAIVPITGLWPESVDIRCCATESDPALTLGPWLQSRMNVPFADLVEQLQATLDEREQVIAATKAGIAGPYRFKHSVWEVVDLMKDIATPNSPSADDSE